MQLLFRPEAEDELLEAQAWYEARSPGMEQKDYWTETLHRKEKADEDRYFAEQDRKLIEKLQRQRQPAQEADTAPPESTTTEPAGT